MNVFKLFVAAVFAAPAFAQPVVDLSAALKSQTGEWEGTLDYRDYQADKWFGLPVKVQIRDGGDGVTQIRVADFDDGPTTGNVRITSVTMLGPDGTSEFTGTFRKGRDAELSRAKLVLTKATDATHWTIVSDTEGRDADRPARIRLTTICDGDNMSTLKEVDFSDDAGESWLQRNRTVLKRVGRL